MKGIQFVVDENNEKKAVLIDLAENAEIWEDFYDALIAKGRADEPRVSLAEVRRRLASRAAS